MRRRQFLSIVGGAAAWPIAARAQQPTMPVVGFLSPASLENRSKELGAFRQGLSETGFVEGRNVAIDYRWAHGRNDLLPALAAKLVQHHVSVIAAFGNPATVAAKGTGTAIPIVFLEAIDPVKRGLVASLNNPGGNLTGVITLNVGLGPKRLEILRELVPTSTDFAVLVNPTNRDNAELTLRDVEAAARRFGLTLHVFYASMESDLDKVFATLAQLRVGGLVIGTDGFFISRSRQLAALALRYKVPTIFQYRKFVASGGLMSYGSNIADTYRQIGIYAGRILKGKKPADLPVQRSSTVELFINLKTAKALGLAVPLRLLSRADEAIE